MKCPDTDRLVELVLGEREDLELMAHLQGCPHCRADLRIIRALPSALRPECGVPETLVRRVGMSLVEENGSRGRRVPAVQIIATSALGAVTVPATILATGSIGSGGPFDLLAFSLAFGLATGLTYHRMEHRSEITT